MIEVRLDELQGVTTAEIESIVRRVCREWRCPDVDDVTQEVLLHIFGKHRKDPSYFDSQHKVLGTVCTDARRVLYRRAEVGRRLKRIPLDADSLADDRTSLEEQEWQRIKALVGGCGELVRRIGSAPKSVQDTFLLLCEGTSRLEVARRLGISVSSVWRYRTVAITMLKQILPGSFE
jgi:DNA-directed RNA polymerase specialized sigma24 family protein